MERKIGEIFEHNGEWYQCIEGRCIDCYFSEKRFLCKQFLTKNFCTSSIIFKKLEKVGEPFKSSDFDDRIVMLQSYKMLTIPYISGVVCYIHYDTNIIDIEIKQTKEDMEENNNIEQTPLEKLIRDFFTNRISDIEFEREVSELYRKHFNPENMGKNLKEFDLEAAKSGKPVYTRDGRKARIICFDAEGNKPLIVLSKIDGKEVILRYTEKGQSDNFHSPTPREDDLMMLPEKKEGWILLRKDGCVFDNEEVAKKNCTDDYFVAKVEWEE